MVSPRKATPQVVLDTNVLVSGLLTPLGPSARLIDLAQRGEIRLLYDDRTFEEYWQVLRITRFGFSPSSIELFLEFVKAEGEHVVAGPLLQEAGSDPSDQPFLEVALSGQADLLVTGNRKHYPSRPPGHLRILNPRAALKFLLSG